MIDIKLIRENSDKVKKAIASKNEKDRVDEILSLDEERRKIIVQVEELKAKRNTVSSQIPKIKLAKTVIGVNKKIHQMKKKIKK